VYWYAEVAFAELELQLAFGALLALVCSLALALLPVVALEVLAIVDAFVLAALSFPVCFVLSSGGWPLD
jgi:hypothetical protein